MTDHMLEAIEEYRWREILTWISQQEEAWKMAADRPWPSQMGDYGPAIRADKKAGQAIIQLLDELRGLVPVPNQSEVNDESPTLIEDALWALTDSSDALCDIAARCDGVGLYDRSGINVSDQLVSSMRLTAEHLVLLRRYVFSTLSLAPPV